MGFLQSYSVSKKREEETVLNKCLQSYSVSMKRE